ncbi:hypothetical protein EfmAA96_11190 [Enterococcus faecium]|nr:hypothetical protein EfmAA96_11190 [Enterococcus faecium]
MVEDHFVADFSDYESFEQQKKLLHDRYGALSMDDRRQILCKLRKRNILMYRQLERLKHMFSVDVLHVLLILAHLST